MLGHHFINQTKDVIRLSLPFILIFRDQVVSHLLVLDIFIDEFSRCTWVYLMKDIYEFLSIFMSFFNEIENQFGKTIKIFRSDNAKEYFSHDLSSF